MLATIAFAISSLSAAIIFLLCWQGLLNTYLGGGPQRVKVAFQHQLWYLVIFGFLAGCIFTVL